MRTKWTLEKLQLFVNERGHSLQKDESFDTTYDFVGFSCGNGHEWRAQLNSYLRGSGCPYCWEEKCDKNQEENYKKRIELIQNRANVREAKFNQLKAILDCKKIELLTPFSAEFRPSGSVTLQCENGHDSFEWLGIVQKLVKGRGCPKCASIEKSKKMVLAKKILKTGTNVPNSLEK